MDNQTARYFEQDFLKDIQKVGQDVFQKYQPIINMYNKVVIPFEKKRLQENQNLIFQNSTLEKDKIQLQTKIEALRAQNSRIQYSLQKQSKKISQLEGHKEKLQKHILCKEGEIESLMLCNQDYAITIEKNEKDIIQLQKDKETIFAQYQKKSGDYNSLLHNYIKDKNELAQKLNEMNQLQYNLHEKEKQLKAQKFYLQKQWEEFEQTQKNNKKDTPQSKIQKKNTSRIFGSLIKQQIKIQQEVKQKNINNQILRTPLKKIVKYHQSQIYQISFNYSGNLLASCGGDRCIKTFDLTNMRPAINIYSNSPQNIYVSTALSYGGQRLLAGSTDKNVYIFNSQTAKLLHSFPGHGDKVNSVSWSSTKQKFISGSQDKQLKIWDIQKFSNVLSVNCGRGIKVIKSNSVEPVVYTGHSDGSVRVYSINQGNAPVSQIKGIVDYPISSISLMSDRYQVLITSLQGSGSMIVDLKTNKAVKKYEHKQFFNSSAHSCLSPSQGLVIAGNCNGKLYYWDRFKGSFLKQISGHDGPVTALNYNFMNSLLATSDKEGSMIIWQ